MARHKQPPPSVAYGHLLQRRDLSTNGQGELAKGVRAVDIAYVLLGLCVAASVALPAVPWLYIGLAVRLVSDGQNRGWQRFDNEG